MSKTTTAPPRYQDGDVADVECCSTHGVNVHIYYSKTGAWSGRCGFIYPPVPPIPHRLKEPTYAEPWQPPTQPTGVRIRRMDGTVETLPLSTTCEVVVRRVGRTVDEVERGIEPLVVRDGASAIHSVTFIYAKENTHGS